VRYDACIFADAFTIDAALTPGVMSQARRRRQRQAPRDAQLLFFLHYARLRRAPCRTPIFMPLRAPCARYFCAMLTRSISRSSSGAAFALPMIYAAPGYASALRSAAHFSLTHAEESAATITQMFFERCRHGAAVSMHARVERDASAVAAPAERRYVIFAMPAHAAETRQLMVFISTLERQRLHATLFRCPFFFLASITMPPLIFDKMRCLFTTF